jgi:excinuclease ABC subunit C
MPRAAISRVKRRAANTKTQLAALRDTVRAGAADRPGIYRMLAEGGEVLYVGKSKRVRTRLLSYFRSAWPADKGARIVREASAIEWEYCPSEFAALLRELHLIKLFRPRFNTMQKRDARHYVFVKLTRAPAPKLLAVRGAGGEGGVYFGPFLGARRVGEAIRELSDALGLRDCALDTRMHFSDQPELFHGPAFARTPGCIRHDVGKCLGPCVGACSSVDYDARIALARAFLEGQTDGPIPTLEREMTEAAERLAFERAAALRDKLRRLEALQAQFARLRFAVETLTFLYSVPGYDGEDRVYLIHRGCVRADEPAPRCESDHERLRALVGTVYAGPERRTTAVPAHEIDELLLLSSWFSRFPDELERADRTAVGVA